MAISSCNPESPLRLFRATASCRYAVGALTCTQGYKLILWDVGDEISIPQL